MVYVAAERDVPISKPTTTKEELAIEEGIGQQNEAIQLLSRLDQKPLVVRDV